MTLCPPVSRFSFGRVAALLMIVAAATPARTSLPPSAVVRLLELQKPIQETLAGGQTHRYSVKLSAGEFVRILVEQRGADVTLTLSGPNEQKIAQMDSRRTERGVEMLSWVAESAGNYLIDVRSRDKDAPAGRYEIRMDQLFAATERERKLVAANSLVAAADVLFGSREKLAIAQATEKYGEALSIFELTGDWQMRAVVLNKLGRQSFALGDYQKAAESHRKALELARTGGDRQAEAEALT